MAKINLRHKRFISSYGLSIREARIGTHGQK